MYKIAGGAGGAVGVVIIVIIIVSVICIVKKNGLTRDRRSDDSVIFHPNDVSSIGGADSLFESPNPPPPSTNHSYTNPDQFIDDQYLQIRGLV